MGLVMDFGQGAHLSPLVDTIVPVYTAALKGGMTVSARQTHADCHLWS